MSTYHLKRTRTFGPFKKTFANHAHYSIRRDAAVLSKVTICKYDLKKKVHRSDLKHPNWCLPDNIKRFTCLISHLPKSCAAQGSETADSPLEVNLKWREAQWAECDSLSLLLLWLELLDHEITGPNGRGQWDNLIASKVSTFTAERHMISKIFPAWCIVKYLPMCPL